MKANRGFLYEKYLCWPHSHAVCVLPLRVQRRLRGGRGGAPPDPRRRRTVHLRPRPSVGRGPLPFTLTPRQCLHSMFSDATVPLWCVRYEYIPRIRLIPHPSFHSATVQCIMIISTFQSGPCPTNILDEILSEEEVQIFVPGGVGRDGPCRRLPPTHRHRGRRRNGPPARMPGPLQSCATLRQRSVSVGCIVWCGGKDVELRPRGLPHSPLVPGAPLSLLSD